MFAANIGWAAPAGLGFSLGTTKRLLVMGGDGGLQMTSGSIGDYVKCGSNAIWVCVNNDGCECLSLLPLLVVVCTAHACWTLGTSLRPF
jgi:TPP-dependent 2-oxoacid decarboxylase